MKEFLINSLAVVCPELSEEFHPNKNLPLTAMTITYGAEKKVWWLCKTCKHEWQAYISNRRHSYKKNNKGTGCPNCINRVSNLENSFAAQNPDLIEEWHPTKNLPDIIYGIFPTSKKKYNWICSRCEHEWEVSAHSRSCGAGCPECGKFKNRKYLNEKQIFEKSNQTLILKSKFDKLGK